MERLALRISTVMALLGGGVEPLPTLAEANVFDSLNVAADDLSADDRAPIIVVRTEDDASQFAGAFKGRAIDLVLQLAICHGGTGTLLENIAVTDSNAEAMLDLLEFQCRAALRGYGRWGQWWSRAPGGYRYTTWNSVRLWPQPRTSLVRLAAREITLNVIVDDDCLPGMIRASERLLDSLGEPIDPVGALPATLVSVFDYIAAHAAGDAKEWAAELRASLAAEKLPAAAVGDDLLSVVAKWPNPSVPPPGEAETTFVEANLLADQD